MQKITPFLWFDNSAGEAADFYTSIFKNSSMEKVARYGAGAPGPEGSVMVATFRIEGQEFIALNGGPVYAFTPAISFVVNCETQDEIDYYWEKLTEGGEPVQCGWLKDKFGVSWQIVPTAMGKLMSSNVPAKSQRVMAAMMQMVKLDVNVLQQAYDQS